MLQYVKRVVKTNGKRLSVMIVYIVCCSLAHPRMTRIAKVPEEATPMTTLTRPMTANELLDSRLASAGC